MAYAARRQPHRTQAHLPQFLLCPTYCLKCKNGKIYPFFCLTGWWPLFVTAVQRDVRSELDDAAGPRRISSVLSWRGVTVWSARLCHSGMYLLQNSLFVTYTTPRSVVFTMLLPEVVAYVATHVNSVPEAVTAVRAVRFIPVGSALSENCEDATRWVGDRLR